MEHKRIRAARALLWAVTAALAAATVVLYAPAVRPAAVEAGALPAVVNDAGRLDLNTATAAQLEELPSIGPVLAQRILQARAENGPFAGPDALQQVPGVGPAVWEAIAPFVRFGAGE